MSSKVKRKPFAHHATNLRSQKSGKMFQLSLQEHWLVRHRTLPCVGHGVSNSYTAGSAPANSMDTAQPMRSHTSKPPLSTSSRATQPWVNPKSTWRCFWILRLSQWHFNKI